MKHVFYVHSHITFLIANSVIAYFKIPIIDVIIIIGRNYQPYPTQQKFTLISLNYNQNQITKAPTYGGPFFWLLNLRTLRSIDLTLTKLTDDQLFDIYLPSNRNYLMQYIATHPKCRYLKLLEEGTMSYKSDVYKKNNPSFNGQLGKLKKWAKWLNHGGRSNYFEPLKQNGNVSMFGFHDALAKSLQRCDLEVTILPLKPNLADDEKTKYQLPKGTIIIIMDALEELGFANSQQLENTLEPFLNSLQASSEVYIKHHPAQINTSSLTAFFKKKGIKIREIPPNMAVELFLVHSDDLLVVGFYSSLLLYAKLLGHHNMTLYLFLEQFSTKSTAWRRQAMPAIFEENVTHFR